MRKSFILVIASFLTTILAFISPAYTQTIVVVPNNLENTEGDTGTLIPFDCSGVLTEVRYQQVYLGSQFPQEGLIDRISFRLFNSGGGNPGFGPTVVPNILIELSTTQAQPNALSTTFADNVGPDVTEVYSGDITLSALPCATLPCPFDVMIPLQEAFFYDPQDGNLLLDFRIPVCSVTEPVDAADNFDTITNVVAATNNDVESPTGTIQDLGNVTQFRIIELDRPEHNGSNGCALAGANSTNGASALFVLLGYLLIPGVIVVRRRFRRR